ncbi:hypothetical protein HAX54_047834 [Datura stramonium]|uniref:Uncharacterized protein n=1 Tax=Datura stramonium TaxID=4076 RepID=A0ABS8STH8_DATST|nr:hypothetical protein [Datura stramonium]
MNRFSKGSRYLLEPLARALRELVAEKKKKVYSFNIPAYYPSPAEVMYIVDKEGSFTIDVLETSELHMDASDDHENMAQCVRAVTESLLVNHFGHDDEVMDQVFQKCRDLCQLHS